MFALRDVSRLSLHHCMLNMLQVSNGCLLATRRVPSSFNVEIREKGNNSSLRDSIFKWNVHYVND